MILVSAEKFFLWVQRQLKIGGDEESFYLLLDLDGGISKKELNNLKINQVENIKLKTTLFSIENKWIKHLKESIPIQYLCSNTYWRDLQLYVSEDVLIPRSESELIVDIATNLITDSEKQIIFCDLGTGSGAIAIALSLLRPKWIGYASDIDQNVINIALQNFNKLSNASNMNFCCGNWWEPLKSISGNIDLAVSNPPYIPEAVYKKLPPEIKNYEPKLALHGGEDGLANINQIIKDAPIYLKQKGWLIIENHFDQGLAVKNIFSENGFDSIKVIDDLCGVGRFTIGRYK